MYIKTFRGQNFKSIFDSGTINFSEGINVITGQNNVGKSALLQLISAHFPALPHRSKKTIPIPSISSPSPFSKAQFEISLPIGEFLEYTFANDQNEFILEYSARFGTDINLMKLIRLGSFSEIFGQDVILCIELQNGHLYDSYFKEIGKSTGQYIRFTIDHKSRHLLNESTFGGGDRQQDTSRKIASRLLERIYRFGAERFNIGHCLFGKNSVLLQHATNLPEVLGILQSDPTKFERYNNWIRSIFPQIFRIAIKPHPTENNHVQILLYNEEPSQERTDLLVPLSESGTGVAQVLAILYVVLISEISHVIIIDEPNSFLHPGAARKLIEILKANSKHQFIIATHSPSTISAANPKSIHIIKYENAMSSVAEIDLKETQNQIYYLAEIGAKLSDVYGSDNILWVEGKTEEICFPKIVEKMDGVLLMGTTILGVKHTGDFERKEPQNIFHIYSKLSTGKGLLPPAIGFFFDRENRTKTEINDLKRQSKDIVVFTNRKMFENYLINTDGILNTMNSNDEIKVTREEISTWIEKNKWEKQFINKTDVDERNDEKWKTEVDGAKFLAALFTNLTEGKLTFDKIKHSVGLCEWIINNSFDELIEIQEVLKNFLVKKS